MFIFTSNNVSCWRDLHKRVLHPTYAWMCTVILMLVLDGAYISLKFHYARRNSLLRWTKIISEYTEFLVDGFFSPERRKNEIVVEIVTVILIFTRYCKRIVLHTYSNWYVFLELHLNICEWKRWENVQDYLQSFVKFVVLHNALNCD